MKSVEDVVKSVVALQLGIDPKKLKESTRLADLNADSLDYVEILLLLEDDLKIIVPQDQEEALLKSVKTVGDLIQFFSHIQNPNRSTTMATEKPKNHNKRWTDADVSSLILSYAAGTSLDLIAKNLGRTVISVLDRLRNHGLVTFDKDANAYFTVPALLYKFD